MEGWLCPALLDYIEEAPAEVAALASVPSEKAEAHYNAYRAALEKRKWDVAFQELSSAAKLNPERFEPFPFDKYQPQRILGGGGFGIAFLCRHAHMNANVVVKTFHAEFLGQDVTKVFAEGQVLRQLDHPAIIRVIDCGFMSGSTKERPFMVMDHFEGISLEEYVKSQGPLSARQLATLMQPVVEGMIAAHARGIIHRDIKPHNLLIRKTGLSWQAKIIDFGLALRQQIIANASTSNSGRTLLSSTIAGTIDYAAPEQLGKLPGVPVASYSDIYGFGKTCCYALFQTTDLLFSHWQSLSPSFAKVLESCLQRLPEKRPATFSEVLEMLSQVKDDQPPPPKQTDEIITILESGKDYITQKYTLEKIKEKNLRQYAPKLEEIVRRKPSFWLSTETLSILVEWGLASDDLVYCALQEIFAESTIRIIGEHNLRQFEDALGMIFRTGKKKDDRTEAYKVLLGWGGTEELVVTGLHDSVIEIRIVAMEEIGKRNLRQYSEALKDRLLNHGDSAVRKAALSILVKWGDVSEDLLDHLLKDEDEWSRCAAIDEIGKRELRRFSAILVEYGKNEKESAVRRAALSILVEWGDVSEDLLDHLLKEKNHLFHRAAVEVIGKRDLRQYAGALAELVGKWNEETIVQSFSENSVYKLCPIVLDLLGKWGAETETLAEVMQNNTNDLSIRQKAFEALISSGKASEDIIEWGLKNNDEDEKGFVKIAIKGIGRLRLQRFRNVLIEMVKNLIEDKEWGKKQQELAFDALMQYENLPEDFLEWGLNHRFGTDDGKEENFIKQIKFIQFIGNQGLRKLAGMVGLCANRYVDCWCCDYRDDLKVIIQTLVKLTKSPDQPPDEAALKKRFWKSFWASSKSQAMTSNLPTAFRREGNR